MCAVNTAECCISGLCISDQASSLVIIMGQNKESAAKLGKEFFREIGAKGGSKQNVTKGFAYMKKHEPEKFKAMLENRGKKKLDNLT